MAVVVPPARGVTGRVDTGGGSTTRRALLQGASTLSCMFTLFYGFGVIGNGLLTFVCYSRGGFGRGRGAPPAAE